jgi:hypothetical protein
VTDTEGAGRVVSFRPFIALLAGCIVLLVFLGLLSREMDLANLEAHGGYADPILFAQLFDLGSEGNIPTWFSVILLGMIGMVLLVAGVAGRAAGTGGLRWWFMAFVAFFLSADESAELHERLADLGESMVDERTGLVTFAWVVPGAILAVTVGALLLWAAWTIPPRVRWGLVAGGVIFLTGALGVEALSGAIAERHGLLDRRYIYAVAVEEGLEMTGALVALWAALSSMRATYLPGAAGAARLELRP